MHDVTTRTADTRKMNIVLIMVCIYIFLFIERPWESIRYLHDIPIERPYAILLIIVALLHHKFKIVSSPINKWVYGILALHFMLSPFAFSPSDAVDQSIEYAKMVVLYLLMLSVAEDEESLKLLIKVYVFSMFFYMLHSLWEFNNGRYVWRMGIVRMVGVGETMSDPNAFGASVVLSLPFAYTLLRTELLPLLRKFYYLYFAIGVVCIVLTGSRSSFIALITLLLLWALSQQGMKRIKMLLALVISVGVLWVSMPAEKQERIRTLWDEEAGPANAHASAEGRLIGWKVSWEMFKREPFTGVGVGGKNFSGYRRMINFNEEGEEAALQSHILYGQVLAEQGLFGFMLFLGLVSSITCTSFLIKKKIAIKSNVTNFSKSISGSVILSLLLLLLLGLGGHNFYRPLWLWLAAWIGALLNISTKYKP